MITNWYTVNVSPEFLSDRLRGAYSWWLANSSPEEIPSHTDLKTAKHYAKLKDYQVVLAGTVDTEGRNLTCAHVGVKVTELFQQDMLGRPFDDFLTEAGRSLVDEVFGLFANANKPVHVRIANSVILSQDVEIMVFPLSANGEGQELALMIYDF